MRSGADVQALAAYFRNWGYFFLAIGALERILAPIEALRGRQLS
jgi:hypothetical protein